MFRLRVWPTIGAVTLLTLFASSPMAAQAPRGGEAGAQKDQQTAGDGAARGKYIVENVALCGRCHSPLDSSGLRDRSRWLMGGPVDSRPTVKNDDWVLTAPRLAGSLPGTEQDVVRALTTGMHRSGRPLRAPMPQFRMTQGDAEAVVAYLKSLGGNAPESTR